MKTPSMTVVMDDGVRYGADVITGVVEAGDDGRGQMLAFVCSGDIQKVPVADVDRIDVREGDRDICMHCTT